MENDKDGNVKGIEAKRAEAAEELRAAFAELESDEGLTRFVGGHGIQSRVFEFEWSDPALEISFRIPYARVLSDEVSQKEDEEEVGAAIRMAIRILSTAGRMESVSRLEVSCDDRGGLDAARQTLRIRVRRLPGITFNHLAVAAVKNTCLSHCKRDRQKVAKGADSHLMEGKGK